MKKGELQSPAGPPHFRLCLQIVATVMASAVPAQNDLTPLLRQRARRKRRPGS